MKENIADSVLAKINKRVESVAKRLSGQYGGVKPFDSQPVKPEDQIYYVDHLGLEDMNYLIAKYGRDKVNEFLYETEMRRRRTNVKQK